MKILITNHWFKRYGGSETFTYAIGKELLRRGHTVHLFTNVPGPLSDLMAKEGISRQLDAAYDLILANHNTCVEAVRGRGFMIQTCHGTTPVLEQPSKLANAHVAISEEVQQHLKNKGFESTVIRNGIDCSRFMPIIPINDTLTNVLSLAHSDEANAIIEAACRYASVNFMKLNKYVNGVFDVERYINAADLVITLGRGAYEAMACGRNVVVFDARPYQKAIGDGFVAGDKWIRNFAATNFSGRYLKQVYDYKLLAREFKLYHPKYGLENRTAALEMFNIEKQVDKYLEVVGKV